MTFEYEKTLTEPERDTLARMLTRAIRKKQLMDEVHQVMADEEATARQRSQVVQKWMAFVLQKGKI